VSDLSDTSTLQGVSFGYGLDELSGDEVAWKALTEEAPGYEQAGTPSVSETTGQATTTFNFDWVPAVATTQEFNVVMDESATAELTFESNVTHITRNDADQPQIRKTITLEPQTFLKDIGLHPFEDSIRKLTEQTGVSGYPSASTSDYAGRNFKPERDLTRAEFVSLIDDALIPDSYDPINMEDFVDIDGHWAEEKIRRVATAGYISGYPDGTFRPDNSITKVEVLVALDAGEGYAGGDISWLPSKFDDADQIPSWAEQAVADVIHEWGFIRNYPDDDMLEPNKNATRAEAAKYVYEAYTES
jgi:hypothetical protein